MAEFFHTESASYEQIKDSELINLSEKLAKLEQESRLKSTSHLMVQVALSLGSYLQTLAQLDCLKLKEKKIFFS